MQPSKGSSSQELLNKQLNKGISSQELLNKQLNKGSSGQELLRQQSDKGSSGQELLRKQSNKDSSSSESGCPFVINGLGRQEMNQSLCYHYPVFYGPLSMASAGYYGAAASSIAGTMTSATSVTNASFQHTYPYRQDAAVHNLFIHQAAGFLPGMALPREVSLGTGQGFMGTGLSGPSFKSKNKDHSDCDVSASGTQQEGVGFSTYPSINVPFTSSPSFTVSATSGGNSTSILTTMAPSNATTTSSVVAETDSGHPTTTQEAEGSKIAMLEGQESSITNVSSSSSLTKKRHQSMSDKQTDEVYLEKRRRNNQSVKRSRENRRLKAKMVEQRIVLFEQDISDIRNDVFHLEKYVGVREQCLKLRSGNPFIAEVILRAAAYSPFHKNLAFVSRF